MPVRNCQETLAIAIRSIVLQSYAHWELLLIDDGSSDATLQVAQGFHDERIRCFFDGKSLGLGERLNQAIALSRGEFFARMDGDDVAYPQRLERQAHFLCEHSDVDLIGAGMMVFGINGLVLGKRGGETKHLEICAQPFSGIRISHPTFFGRLAWFQHWKYNPTAQSVCDQDLLLRAYASSTLANVAEILQGYRESRILLRKTLGYRVLFSRAIISRFGKDRLDYVFRGLAGQFLKGAVDAFAVDSGLNYRLLRHRAQPVTDDEQRAWEHVWRSVQKSVVDG